MPKKEGYLESIIENIDNPSAEYKKHYYKFIKLERMKMFNHEVVNIFLSLLHKMYWIWFPEKKEDVNQVDFYIARLIPIVQKLYDSLMEELENEFPIDEIDKKL